jgi:DNA polymerase-1
MTELKKRLVVVDGNAILHRAWHAFTPLQTKDGRLVHAAYGFTVMLMKAIRDLKPTHVAVTFDLPGGTFRHDAFAEYKAQRVKQPDELYAQIPMVKEVLAGLHIPVYEAPGFEADDVIGTLSKLAPVDCETIIVTGDNDTLQLVDKKTKVLSPRKGMSDTVLYDEAAVRERYGLEPNQLIDYKAMRGDTSDNLPGLRGIGEKRAEELLQKYHDIESIYRAVKAHPEDFKPGVLIALQNGEKEVPLSKKLVTIIRDLDINFKMTDAAVKPPDLEKLRVVFADFEFHSLMARFDKEAGTSLAVPAAAHESFANRRTLASDSGSFRGRPPGRPTNTQRN